jgi:hypothetical protein
MRSATARPGSRLGLGIRAAHTDRQEDRVVTETVDGTVVAHAEQARTEQPPRPLHVQHRQSFRHAWGEGHRGLRTAQKPGQRMEGRGCDVHAGDVGDATAAPAPAAASPSSTSVSTLSSSSSSPSSLPPAPAAASPSAAASRRRWASGLPSAACGAARPMSSNPGSTSRRLSSSSSSRRKSNSAASRDEPPRAAMLIDMGATVK